jgi:hypothetical protein
MAKHKWDVNGTYRKNGVTEHVTLQVTSPFQWQAEIKALSKMKKLYPHGTDHKVSASWERS